MKRILKWLETKFSRHSVTVEVDERVGGEFLFKLPLAADTNHGSRNSIGNCSGEQCFDQCWPASAQNCPKITHSCNMQGSPIQVACPKLEVTVQK